MFFNHLREQDPSQATFDYLRTRRAVCRRARNRVDNVLADADWCGPWLQRAHEFCNDLPAGMRLAPGAPPNVGLERMIQTNPMAELVIGMHEFKMDATTQELCIQQLQAMLEPPFVPGVQNPYLELILRT